MSIAQDWCESWQEILNRWCHVRHTDDIHDRLQCAENRCEHIRVLLTEILIQDDTQMLHQLLFIAGLEYDSDTRDQIGRLLSYTRQLVIQTPFDDTADLR